LVSFTRIVTPLTKVVVAPGIAGVLFHYLHACSVGIDWWVLKESNHLATALLNNAYRVTAGNREQHPKSLNIVEHTVVISLATRCAHR